MWRWPSSPCPPVATGAPEAADLDRPVLDLATVVYRDELPLIRLQARSIARMLDPRGIGAILVMANDREEEACLAALQDILPDYGPFADRVELLRPADLFALRPSRLGPRGPLQRVKAAFTANRSRYPFGVKGGWRGNRGWAMQQALKLAVARRGEAANLCILDAKNHFIRPVGVEAMVAEDGRPRARLELPNAKHRRWNKAAFRLLGTPPPGRDDRAPPTLTPFVVSRADLLATLEALEARVGPAEAFFARKRSEESEFALIHAAIARRPGGVEAAFAPGLRAAATLRRKKDDATVDRLLTRVEQGEADMLSIHRTLLGRLKPEHLARLNAIWAAAGLDASELLSADAARRDAASGSQPA